MAIANDFLQWINKAPYRTLLAMGESKAKQFQVLALTDAAAAHVGNLKLDSANENLRRAQRYLHFVDVLQEFANAPSPPEIAKLT